MVVTGSGSFNFGLNKTPLPLLPHFNNLIDAEERAGVLKGLIIPQGQVQLLIPQLALEALNCLADRLAVNPFNHRKIVRTLLLGLTQPRYVRGTAFWLTATHAEYLGCVSPT